MFGLPKLSRILTPEPARSAVTNTSDEGRAVFPLTLRPYQIEGAHFLEGKKRAILGDVPGLGKTIQAIHATTGPVLVACPTYLVEQWADVLAREAQPDASILVARGTRPKKEKVLAARADWTVINTEMFRSYTFPKGFYQTLIVDESHWLRGRNSLQAKGAFRLAQTVPFVYLLTGTPVVKEVDDLWMQLHILNPKEFASYWQFVEFFCKTVTDQYSTKVVGVREPALLKVVLSRYMLRRTYADVGLYLPKLIDQDVSIRPSPTTARLYNQIGREYRSPDDITYESAGAIMHALRRATVCLEKIEACLALLEDARHTTDPLTSGSDRSANGGAVVYCWYKETARQLGEALEVPVIDGDIAPAERAAIAKSNKVVVATLASLSEGVDLSEKKTVIFFEADYTPGRLEQSLARLQRWTDKDNAAAPVRAYYLTLRDTIDETILKLVRRRVYDIVQILRTELFGKRGHE